MSTEDSVLFFININSTKCRTAKSSTEKCSARKDLQFHVYFVKKYHFELDTFFKRDFQLPILVHRRH